MTHQAHDRAPTSSEVGALLVVRHGQTEWSAVGRHTSTTDLPLLPEGEEQARRLYPALARYAPQRVLSSPRQRARQTAALAGFDNPEIDPDLAEWDYGDLEGRTRAEIQRDQPGWTVWTGALPHGELITDVAARAGRIIARVWPQISAGENVAVFCHGHYARVLMVTWLGLAPADGRMFSLDAGCYGVLGEDRGQRVVQRWNQSS